MPNAQPLSKKTTVICSDLIAVGFGTSALMWLGAYLGHMPGITAPKLMLLLFFLSLIAGGFLLGRFTQRCLGAQLISPLITACINLLIIGSLASDQSIAQEMPAPTIWIPSTIALTLFIGLIGILIGRRFRPTESTTLNWPWLMGGVAILTTILVLIAGGLVTGYRGGLAVQDWPTSEGFNMFLYPVSLMKGNKFYEHAHRLYGALLGLTTLAYMILLFIEDRRRWIKIAAVLLFLAVCVQGYMGGRRVTEANIQNNVELAEKKHETQTSSTLRVAHGVFAQFFLAMLVGVSIGTSRTWRQMTAPQEADSRTAIDSRLGAAIVGMLMLQLILGAFVRHLHANPMWHMAFAILIVLGVATYGLRSFTITDQSPLIRRLSLCLVIAVFLQLALGFGAAAVTGFSTVMREKLALQEVSAVKIIFTSAHHAVGATLLGLAVGLATLHWRRHAISQK